MKISVNYTNGDIFQHFGDTKFFKIYEVEDNKVVSSMVIPANPLGHVTLATQLINEKIDVVICGGLGDRMLHLLEDAGMQVCGNVKGNADQAVEAYLNGTLQYSRQAHACSCHH